jgi:eukaryotic-like serine/threonine-protein kinase
VDTEEGNLDTPLERAGGGERFAVVRKLGEGGMAVVYEAIDTKLGERRALKFSKPGRGRAISPEARAAMKVTHENVCRLFEVHTAQTQDGPLDFLSMEYVEGETLAERCARAPVGHAEALDIARQLCRGVAAAHAAQVLHLDLKGANVMLGANGAGGHRVIVMDFGLAQVFSGGDNSLAGTRPYIAPERYRGAPPTPAADVYAMGVILYEMLTGRLPGQAPDPPSRVARDRVNPRWDAIVMQCLAEDPAARTASAAELLRAIDAAFTPSHTRRWVAAGTALLLLGAAVFGMRERIWPEPPLARLAVLPMKGTTGNKQLDETLRGGLTETATRLESLGAESQRLVLIPPEMTEQYHVTTAEKANGALGATHVLMSAVEAKRDRIGIRAEVRAAGSGDLVRNFEADFPANDLTGISTSLAGVVTSAFRLRKAVPAEVKPEAYPLYATGLGLLARNRVSYDRALALFDSALDLDRNSPLILAARAAALIQKHVATDEKRWLDLAAESARSAEQLHPDSPPILQALGDIERHNGRPEKALDYYNRAVMLEPNRSDAWRMMGIALDKAGKEGESIAALRKAIELAPGHFAPHSALATVHFQRGRVREAVEEYRKMVDLVPEMPESHASYGGALMMAGQDAEAEKALRRSLGLRETRQALNNLGVLLRYQRRDAEAVEVFTKALGLGADTVPARLNLAAALRTNRRHGEARVQFMKAGELARAILLRNPRDATARAQLAFTQAATGNVEAGLDNALQAAQLDATQYAVLFWVSMTMEALGRRELAVPMLRGATPAQLRDLRRQPDLQEFVNDERYKALFTGGSPE